MEVDLKTQVISQSLHAPSTGYSKRGSEQGHCYTNSPHRRLLPSPVLPSWPCLP